MTIHELQNLNRATIAYISSIIKPGMPLGDIRYCCEQYMLDHGADSFWYWDVGAFVFSGKETAISVSGRSYTTSSSIIETDDIITIDLSPQHQNIWGDFARTIILENGAIVKSINEIKIKEWHDGLLMQEYLHQEMIRFVTLETTFEELYFHINSIILDNGYINLDFAGNLGHSIETDKANRIYTEKGNHTKLSAVTAFTFEPHIAIPHSPYGFKKENIYRFQNDRLVEE